MMHRKKNSGNGCASHSIPDVHDDGGAAKQKSSHLLFTPRFQAALGPFSSTSSKHSFSQGKPHPSPSYCLPGVPVVLKLILLSFVGFAVLVVLTAKGRHAHWRYPNETKGPHMPEPLMDVLERKIEREKGGHRENVDENGQKIVLPTGASQRMIAQPSRFVDSEKKLKQQLLKLLGKQNAERKKQPKDPDDSVLGVKISNRYLSEDFLPYPESKGGEKEWEKKMDKRATELRKRDEDEWNDMMQQYNDVMRNYVYENEFTESESSSNANDSEHDIQQRIDDIANENKMTPQKGTARWPSPAERAGPDTTILLKPAFGSHQSSSDAIFAFAEGYELSIYLAFVESLINTGYSGDLVLSISNEEKLKPDVKEYLQSKSSLTGGVNIVAYEMNWSCFKRSGEETQGSNEGINHCKMNDVFGDTSSNPVPDPREPRPVATARYELYWIWSLHYNKESWLMLIDARDVWFQLHPFQELTSKGKVSGELHLFEENAEAVKIGTSTYNRNWLIAAYSKKAVSSFFEQPVICSGSTIGNQDAIETYLRAMVAEYDATLCKSKGCDQGFHNYLYYSKKLGLVDNENNLEGISKVIVHEQGKGIINNLAALRSKPLEDWGMYDAEKQLVINWDGTTSAVAHQYDRDKQVNSMVKGKKRQFNQQWTAKKKLYRANLKYR